MQEEKKVSAEVTENKGKPGQGNGNSNPGQGGNNPGQGGGNGGDKKVTLTIIVSGTPTTVEANPKQKLQVIAMKALENTNNTGRPLSDWDLKTRAGVLLEYENTVESYNLKDGDQLVLSLKAGVGGNW